MEKLLENSQNFSVIDIFYMSHESERNQERFSLCFLHPVTFDIFFFFLEHCSPESNLVKNRMPEEPST